MDDDGYFSVEAVVGHQLSDPRTHPAGLGTSPVMLYFTKWVGYDEPTWEPASSFEDQSILREYDERAGIKRATSANVRAQG